MMRILAVGSMAGLLALGFSGCTSFTGWRAILGSGNVVSQDRPVSGFDRVSISGVGQVTLVQGDQEGLTIEADDNLLPYIQSEVRGGRLELGPTGANLRPSGDIHYRLKFKNLSDLNLSGAVHAEAASLRANHLDLNLSGAGELELASLDAQSLSSRISGAAKVRAGGTTQSQVIRISGAGHHNAPALRCGQADVDVSGAGNASLWVTDSLSAHVSGAGSVAYRGQPTVNSSVSGAGTVRQMGQ